MVYTTYWDKIRRESQSNLFYFLILKLYLGLMRRTSERSFLSLTGSLFGYILSEHRHSLFLDTFVEKLGL